MVTGMLDPGARRALADTRFAHVEWVDETGSTNQELLERARAGAPEGLVLGADHQTAGRGRLGRTWEAPPGSSLLVSILLRPPLEPAHVHAVPMAVAVSAVAACEEVAGFRPSLKWPNDLVVAVGDGGAERKLAGILAESVVAGDRLEAVVVGMGLNVNWPADLPPELADIAVAANHVAGREVDRAALLVAFLRRLDDHYGALCRSDGWQGIHVAYRERCSTLGRDVRVELAGETFTGQALDITEAGALVVGLEDGSTRHVDAGDVIHLRPRP
jgi:BirA family transcriptional regulator, biotin operon repressor / biotin---[acetyl-CoA-carboxylase] ligase